MIQRSIGIDTSVLARLLTGLPPEQYELCDRELTRLVEEEGVAVLASNQVIGETFVTVQHHYGLTRPQAKAGLLRILTSGIVAPLNGQAVLEALSATGGPGLFGPPSSRDDYSHAGLEDTHARPADGFAAHNPTPREGGLDAGLD